MKMLLCYEASEENSSFSDFITLNNFLTFENKN